MENGEDSTTTVIPCCDWQQKYQALEKRMAAMQKEMVALKDKIKSENKEVRNHCQHFYKLESSTKAEMKELKTKVETLSNVVIRLEHQFNESNKKLTEMQARSMRKNLIISGIEEGKNETSEQLYQKIDSFIKEKLQVNEDIPLKVWHRLNYVDNAEYRPVIIKLKNHNHKMFLLSHGPNLKGARNNKSKAYFINEQLPDVMAEDRKYAQMWIRENKSKPVNDQLQMKIHKNKLRINNEPYQRKVMPPMASEILRMHPQELSATHQAPTLYGGSKLIEGSEFISYAVKVSSVEEVRVAYRKLRVKYADASHILSAYRLDPPNGPYNQEGVDDGEYAGGRCLLAFLQENQVLNTAVFIVRFYGGKHIGSARFDAIRYLAGVACAKLGVIRMPSETPNRRVTRALSQRGARGVRGAIRGGTNSSTLRQPVIQGAWSADFPTDYQSNSMFRPTPLPSPVVSP